MKMIRCFKLFTGCFWQVWH